MQLNSPTSLKRLTKNSLWNLTGQLAPMLVAFATLPFLIRQLGTERFGVLTLVWVVVGYFGLFDFGLGRAIVQILAKHRAHEQSQISPNIANQIFSSLWLLMGIGLAAALFNAFFAPVLVHKVLNIPASLVPEVLTSFLLMSIALPIVLATSGLVGILEGFHRFDLSNRIRIPISMCSYLFPTICSFFHQGLEWVVASVILARGLGFLFYVRQTYKIHPELFKGKLLPWQELKPVWSLGGWMTVSNIISPVMVNMDRFFIGSILTLTMVSYYTTPFEMVSKVLVIPGAIGGVLFAALSEAIHQDRQQAQKLFFHGQKTIFFIILPITLFLMIFANLILKLWVGQEFADHSTQVFQVLAFCIFLNCLGQLPVAYLQGLGRPDQVAKLHALELPIYVLCLYFGVQYFGILGAAAAWFLRVFIDTTILNAVVLTHLKKTVKKK
ncbi:MAG: flippase [Bdellovibrionales bacterium]